MASCPCCGNSLPAAAEPNELCPACSYAMDTGSNEVPGSYEPRERDLLSPSSPEQTPDLSPPRQRPLVVTILAIVYWASAAWVLLFGILFLVAPRAVPVAVRILVPFWHPDSEIYQLGNRLLIAVIAFVFSFLGYLFARGLWRLRNWARGVAIIFYAVDLLPSRVIESSTLWPLSLWVRGPFFELLSLSASLALILYLLSPHVNAAFGVHGGSRTWQLVAGALALVSLGISFSKSGPEFKAVIWHLRHGNRVSVNGTTFPIYSWYAPVQYQTGFEISDDNPGPLRLNDGFGWIDVSICKESESATVEQLVDIKFRDYEKAHYRDLSKFQMQVGKQALSCVQQNGTYSISIYCYGEGPIASIHFAGDEVALRRFTSMMAEAR